MANLPISALQPGAAVSATDLFPDVQTVGLGPVKVTAQQIKTFVNTDPAFNGQIAFESGSVGAPSITHQGDLDTGFWFPSVGAIAASVNGVEAWRITPTGKIGVNQSSPAAQFQVNAASATQPADFYADNNYFVRAIGTAATNGNMGFAAQSKDGSGNTKTVYFQNSAGTGVIATYAADPLSFRTGVGAIERFFITGAGESGAVSDSINAFSVRASGASQLSLNIDSSTDGTGLNIQSQAAGGGVKLSTISSGANDALFIDAKGTGNVIINTVATGKVGINTSSPGAKLDVRTSGSNYPGDFYSDNNYFVRAISNAAASGNAGFAAISKDSGSASTVAYFQNYAGTALISTSAAYPIGLTAGDPIPTNDHHVVIDTTGSVGINNQSPSSSFRLNVTAASGQSPAVFTSTDTGKYVRIGTVSGSGTKTGLQVNAYDTSIVPFVITSYFQNNAGNVEIIKDENFEFRIFSGLNSVFNIGQSTGSGYLTTIPYGTVDIGKTGFGASIGLYGSTSGSVTFGVPAAAGSTTFTLPSTNGSNGSVLQSNGSGETSWSAATFPTTVGAVGTFLRSDGTNWVASTPTISNSTAAGTVLVSGTANTITATSSVTLGASGLAGQLQIFNSSGDGPALNSGGANILQLGAGDVASASAQTLQVQNSTAGAGAAFSIKGSSGTTTGGAVSLTGGAGSGGVGGDLSLIGGSGSTTGGSVYIIGGPGTATAGGSIYLQTRALAGAATTAVTIDVNQNVGIGVAPSATTQTRLTSSGANTGPSSGSGYMNYFTGTYSPAASTSTSAQIGAYFNFIHSVADSTTANTQFYGSDYRVTSRPYMNTTATWGLRLMATIGLTSAADFNGKTLSSLGSLLISTPSFSTATTASSALTISNIYGIHIQDVALNPAGAGTYTFDTLYALYIAGQDAGSRVTTKWAIYSAGTTNSAHNGKFRFGGVTAPSYAVDVTGDIRYSGTVATSAGAPTIASANTIAPTTAIAFVSGTTVIKTITAPAPISAGGGQITLIPTGLWTTDTTGNIALASTAVVSKALIMTYDTTTAKWYPSY